MSRAPFGRGFAAGARRGPGARALLVVAALAIGAAAGGCAGVGGAVRASPGSVSNGAFSPGRDAAADYGGPGTGFACSQGGAMKVFTADMAEIAKDQNKPAPQPDPRLCAVAGSFLGWSDKEAPPESVVRFVTAYFGVPTTTARVSVATIPSDNPREENPRDVAQRLEQSAQQFIATATQPRFGLATLRIGRGEATKVALVMQDAAVDLSPLPRQLPAGGRATLSGKLLGGATNPKVFVCDAAGKLQTPAQQGDAIAAELQCGDRAGPILVDVHAERRGDETSVARFPVYCGAPPPKSVPVPPPAGAVDAAAAAKELFAAMNGDRAAAGLPPLAWDDAVAAVAREAAQAYRSGSLSFDVAAALKKAELASLVVLQNPLAAPTAQEAKALVDSSPVNHCNLLNRDVTHAGVGAVTGQDPSGIALLYVSELLVKELPQVNTEEVRAKLRAAIAQKRADARAGALTPDPVLDDVAQKYAAALARTKGNLPKDQESAVVAPLYKSFRDVNIIGGAKADPLEFAEEPGVTGRGKAVGVGAAQGANPVLGKNATYVVILVGTRK